MRKIRPKNILIILLVYFFVGFLVLAYFVLAKPCECGGCIRAANGGKAICPQCWCPSKIEIFLSMRHLLIQPGFWVWELIWPVAIFSKEHLNVFLNIF